MFSLARLACRAPLAPAARLLVAKQPALPHNRSVNVPRATLASAALSRDDVAARVQAVLAQFEKVEASAVSATAHFVNDLGLDSLDAVEVVMALEDEFGIEIPDDDAEAILSVPQAIDYLSKHPQAK